MPVPIVTIFGGSGFIGRQIAQRMARAGWRVRVAVRRPNEANFVRPYGVVGQVEPIQANIRDEASTRAAIAGAAAVVNCVGIMAEAGRQTFEAVVDEAAGRIARISAEEGVARLVHVSAIGADPRERQPLCRRQGAGRGGGAPGLPRRGPPASLDRLRLRRQLLQPSGRHGPLHARPAARRTGDPLPAGLRQGRGRGRRGRRHNRRVPRRLRARRPRGGHLPRADAAAARDHPAPAPPRHPSLLAGPHPGLVPRPRPAADPRHRRQRHPHPRPGAPARPRQRGRRRMPAA